MMPQTTFEVDEWTVEVIEELKPAFGVRTNAQVLRKALALALVFAWNANAQNAVTIVAPDGERKLVLLSG